MADTALQLQLPLVLDRYEARGAGPAGGSAHRLGLWLDRWRGVPGVRVFSSQDDHELIVVPAAAVEQDERTKLWRLLG